MGGYNVDANPQSSQPESTVETKSSPVPLPLNKDDPTTNDSTKAEVIPPITPPTTKPTTTSTTPPTTTTQTTTTTKPTTTSTPAPTTTTAPTTPAPTTPLPPPSTGKWNVTENNTLCILVQMAVQFNVSHTVDNVVSTQKLSSRYYLWILYKNYY